MYPIFIKFKQIKQIVQLENNYDNYRLVMCLYFLVLPNYLITWSFLKTIFLIFINW